MRIPDQTTADRLDTSALPDGSRHVLGCRVCQLVDGSDLMIPVLVVCGRAAGPRLVIVGGVHGDEADGIAGAFALGDSLSPSDFVGRVTILPVANPMAFAAGRRQSPVDNLDLNRLAPGNAEGTPSERLAATLVAIVRGNADFLYTLHGWNATGEAHPHVEFDSGKGPVQDASRRACFAAGFDLVVATDWLPGLLPKAAVNAGIPAMESEIGGLGASRAANAAFLLERIRDLMAHLGMTAAPASARADGPVYRHCYLAAPASGVLRRVVALGDRVKAGDTLAEIRDLWGRPTSAVVAPVSGVLVTQRSYLSVTVGEPVFTLLVEGRTGA
jgi:N2-acetyl-L-2,4-diaminobutanoate deacetylase